MTISDATNGATIYYTTDGSTPTTASTVYSGPITVSSTETLQAIATASGCLTSVVATAAYTINILPLTATPTISLAGSYTAAQTVILSDTTSGATIYYTTNGSTPTVSSTVYSGPITVSASETLQAMAAASGHANSAVATAIYSVHCLATLTSPTQGATFDGASETFTWVPVAGATSYTLYLGSSVGAGNLLDAHTTATTITADYLPVNGQTVYARLYTSFNGVWKYTDSTFTAHGPATLTSPTHGATFDGAIETFTWAPIIGATSYTLYLGSTGVGSGNLLDAHTTSTTVTATQLPINGMPVYARLWTNVNGVWKYTDSTFNAHSPAMLTSPTQGGTLDGASQTFTWNGIAGVTSYSLYLGSTGVGAGNLLDAHTTATTVTATHLPVNGGTIYARLFTNVNGTWNYIDSHHRGQSGDADFSDGGRDVGGYRPNLHLGGGSRSYQLYPLSWDQRGRGQPAGRSHHGHHRHDRQTADQRRDGLCSAVDQCQWSLDVYGFHIYGAMTSGQ